jgi:DNA-binding transcriptional ArsR family regulator/uncharacterized protein YndB with AHSA1/START domain
VDEVFKALGDPTRRFLLDLLHEHNGQTLGELCERLDMTRQSATKHLSVLEAANLVSTARRGREKLHYLNPVPLHEMQERWIDKFERPRLRAISDIKRRAESTVSDRPAYVYTTYIESTPEKVWAALTDADLTADYWGHRNESDWTVGSTWRHVRTDGSGIADIEGKVLESDPPRRLVTSWEPSIVTYEIEPFQDIVKLTVTHEELATDQDLADASLGWPAVLANLKTLLETGRSMTPAPWTMHR